MRWYPDEHILSQLSESDTCDSCHECLGFMAGSPGFCGHCLALYAYTELYFRVADNWLWRSGGRMEVRAVVRHS
jgi:hypothetical protein